MANFKKIYTGDYSKEGYDGGIDDGKKGKAKWGGFKFFKAVNPINYVWNFSNAFDSFTTNYNTGYLDGQRVEHEVYTSQTNTKEQTMEAQKSYEYHKQLLSRLEENLDSLKNYMDSIEEKYLQQINAMDGAGFYDNYIDPLKDRYITFKNRLQELQELIDRHKQTIDNHQDKLNELINSARS